MGFPLQRSAESVLRGNLLEILVSNLSAERSGQPPIGAES